MQAGATGSVVVMWMSPQGWTPGKEVGWRCLLWRVAVGALGGSGWRSRQGPPPGPFAGSFWHREWLAAEHGGPRRRPDTGLKGSGTRATSTGEEYLTECQVAGCALFAESRAQGRG